LVGDNGIDISRNIRAIENLKAELLETVGRLYRAMCQEDESGDSQARISEELGSLIVKSYVLGKRLGISYPALEAELENRLRIAILKEEAPEKDFKDYSSLLQYLRGKNRGNS